MPILKDKIAIITGASSGIGGAAARVFAREGARLVLMARGEDALRKIADEITAEGGTALICQGDVTKIEDHARAVEMAVSSFGRLDIAFNNAGILGSLKPLAELTPSEWGETLEANLTSAFLGASAQLPAMLEQGSGSLIFTSSFVGNSVGLPNMGAYGAAKAGLSGLVKSLTADYAHRGIRANTLLPGGVDTPMAGDEDSKAWAASLHPVKRIARAEEIANAALFLASDLSSFVLGSDLWADGGNSATKVNASS